MMSKWKSKNSPLTKNVLCVTPLMAYCGTLLSHVGVTKDSRGIACYHPCMDRQGMGRET
jgi:hypothetical protein